MKRGFVFKFILALLFFFLTVDCFAQEEEEVSLPRTHDGYYARFMLGGGYQHFRREDYLPGQDMTFYGFTGDLTLQLGNTVWNNIILYGEISAGMMFAANVKLDDHSYATDTARVTTIWIGGGQTFYAMPVNIFISTTLAAVKSSLETDASTTGSRYGFGFCQSIGKEWWATDDWGLGVALIFRFTTMKHSGDGNHMIGIYGGLSFSATYN